MGIGQLSNQRTHQLAVIGIADGLFFGVIDPEKAASGLFIVAFLLLVLSFYVLLLGICDIGTRYGLRVKHRKRVALTVTAVIAGLLALQSIGQLSAHDLAVVLPLVALGYFYFSYNKRQTRVAT
jgi:hypothetical protein